VDVIWIGCDKRVNLKPS